MAARLYEIEMQLTSQFFFFFLQREEDALVACIYTSSTVFMLGYLGATAAEE